MPTLITADLRKIHDFASDTQPALALASFSGEPYFVLAVKGQQNPSDRIFIGNYPPLNGSVKDTETDVAPALACLNSYLSTTLYLAWKIAGSSTIAVRQCVVGQDGFQTDSSWTHLPITGTNSSDLEAVTDAAPFLAIGADERLYIAWKIPGTSAGEYKSIGWSVYDGTGWSNPQYTSSAEVPPITTDVSPSINLATSSQSSLCLGYTDVSNEVLFFYPNIAGGLNYVPGAATDAGPSLTNGSSGDSFLVWKNQGQKTLSFTTLPLTVPEPTVYVLPQVQTDLGPSSAYWGNTSSGFGAEPFSNLVLAWKDAGSNDIWLGSWPLLSDAVPPPIRGLGGNYNYIFHDNCHEMTQLSVTIEIAQPLIPITTTGFGFQLNCHTPTTDNNSKSGWQQYAVLIDAQGNATGVVDNWNQAGATTTNPTISLNNPPMPSLPAGYEVKITLEFDSSTNNVTGAKFYLITDKGKSYEQHIKLVGSPLYDASGNVTAEYLGPIVAFELEIVGYDMAQKVNFSSGSGTIIYNSNVALTPSSGVPTCALERPGTGEISNTLYAELPTNSSNPITQFFCVNPKLLP